jgi:hypothetical protein
VLKERNRGGRMGDEECAVYELVQMGQEREQKLKIVMAKGG